jgi:2-polyprenyl-6-hydroxyphenyl methylase/3-demethylubiquinone-9 3-methyltransferase
MSILNERISRGGRVLDLGCGGGYVSTALSDAGYEVVGIDPSTKAIRAASQAGDGVFAVAHGEQLPFPAESFHAVICSEVLEHVISPARVLSESARVLTPGGTLLFSGPNRTWMSRLLLVDLAQRWRPTRLLPPELHEWDRFIRPEELGELLIGNGLRINEVRGLGLSRTDVPGAVAASLALKRQRVTYAEAGRRVRLRIGDSTQLAYLGAATAVS